MEYAVLSSRFKGPNGCIYALNRTGRRDEEMKFISDIRRGIKLNSINCIEPV